MPNETRTHKAARKLQKLTELSYQQAFDLLSSKKPWPDFNDPESVEDYLTQTSETTPASDPSELSRLVALALELGTQPEDLDDSVIDAKSEEAADINNNGLDSQLEYLGQEPLTDDEDFYDLRMELEERLDLSVHDAKDAEASTINNSGLKVQLAYLLEGNGYEATERFLRTATWDFILALQVCTHCGEPIEDSKDSTSGYTHTSKGGHSGGVWCNPEYTPDNIQTLAQP